VLSVEAIRVDENHLQKAIRQVLHGEGEEVPIPEKIFLPLVSASVRETRFTPLEKSARPRKYLSPAGEYPSSLSGFRF